MKKLLALLLALTMVFSCLILVGCDKPDDPDEPNTPDTPDNPDTPDDPDTPDNPDDPDTPDTPGEDDNAEAKAAAAPVIEMIEALASITEVNADNYETAQKSYDDAKEAYNALDKDAKEIVGTENKALLNALKVLINTYKNELKAIELKAEYQEYKNSLPQTKIVKGTITLDGQFDELFNAGTPMTLTKEQCDIWNEQKGKEREDDGAGVVGDTTLTEGAETDVSFYFAYDDEYFYVVERRCDLNWCFSAQDYSKSYTGDGSILWFMNTADEAWYSSGSISATPAFGLMWIAGTQGELPGSNNPQIAYFPQNDQSSPVEKTASGQWQYAFGWDDEDMYYYTLEVAIPWSDLPFEKADVDAGNISATFCSVDIVNSEFDGDSQKLWQGWGYQMQYPGVNHWKMSYPLSPVSAD